MSQIPQTHYDIVILGGGGAGLFCAFQSALYRGRSVLIIDHMGKVGGKILISGGGRCNFTNLGASHLNYVSQNPHFMKSALSRFTPQDFLQLIHQHQIDYHEKKLGQLFCDHSARDIVQMLEKECNDSGVQFKLNTKIETVKKNENHFIINTSSGIFTAESLVVATGGLSLPKVGATGIGYTIAQQFGHTIVTTEPALDGFVFGASEKIFTTLAGASLDCNILCGGKTFRENILFTHSGLSGPAALQASLHWYRGQSVTLNLLPDLPLFDWLKQKKQQAHQSLIRNILSEVLPSKFVTLWCELNKIPEIPLNQTPDKELQRIAESLHHWSWVPESTVGYSKAEVTRGGVNTDELSSKTMESKLCPHLYFIGEVVDVTGWLGGYNYQWAWASAWAASQDC